MSTGPGRERTDDLNGSTQDVTAVDFSYEGVAYTVDLNPSNAAAFDAALAPFLTAGRRVGGSRP